MEWDAPAVVLSVRPYGEADAIIRLFSEEHGVVAGLARGGASRRQVALWQPGNIVLARHRARLPGQLGSVTAEPVQDVAVRLLDHPLSLTLLASIAELADGALPDHEAYPALFAALVRLLIAIAVLPDDPPVAMAVRWECMLLAALGYGLRLDSCAVSGVTDDLIYVSPRSGHAVSRAAAGEWAERLLPLPAFLRDAAQDGTAEEWVAGLRMTGYFLGRHLFGVRHLPLPQARERLVSQLQFQPGSRT
ncbi:DNA repair protein RecO [Acidomonas methanolica]|uniref:DNA repair protein RecO n=1 Tax=Acidomonas methanolica NBRC 104435 TaxID=1231351 RepID=A0A023D4E0_ACIMT|nr:DNA repair protein RecO [Acidomonas methanolica]MBU2653279.1 DNA repair protein RecO [Acidomonas methanolica]TCS32228.1 DNA replication and repair protein RecO [Acidomonas methanolica]GAJ29033.1 DNA repair protein RecO [Acidomonas methanolica NBRC 104435]GBQ53004.1 DNA repair protein RecO [Acidomonas methanolica]GEK97663.1 DNA repair protein RecO [Acidomonas methanolica NBRC 104435]